MSKKKKAAEHPTTKRMCDKCDNKVRMQIGTIVVKGDITTTEYKCPACGSNEYEPPKPKTEKKAK